MSDAGTGSSLLIISHRARGFGHPENSEKAIRAALQSQAHALEIDLRLTKDFKWVALHNPYRRSEERQVHAVHERTLAQLRREVIDLDSILALFSAFGAGKELFLDVKDVGEQRQLVRIIKRHKVEDRVVVIGWEPEVLRKVHAIDPKMRIGFSYVPLHSYLSGIRMKPAVPLSRSGYLLSFNEWQSFDARFSIGRTHQHYLAQLPSLPLYSIQVPGVFCSSRLVQEAHQRGIKVIPFLIGGMGVNVRIIAALLRRRGVDGILTDAPRNFL